MIQFLIASLVCGALLWLIGRTLWVGLRSGRMPHSDSTTTADRRRSPLLFWLVTIVFALLFALIAAAWLQAVLTLIALK